MTWKATKRTVCADCGGDLSPLDVGKARFVCGHCKGLKMQEIAKDYWRRRKLSSGTSFSQK